MATQAAGGNDFVNLSTAPYNISPSATAAANTAALVQAYTDHRRSTTIGGKKLYIPGNSSAYPFNATTPTSPGRLIGDGMGSTRLLFPPGGPFTLSAFQWRTSGSGSRQLVSSTMTQGDTVITSIASTAGWAPGDWVCITTTATWPGTNSGAQKGEWIRIRSVDSASQITVWEPLEDSYTSGISYLTKAVFWRNCSVEGVTFDNNSPGTAPAGNDDLAYAQCVVRGVENLHMAAVEVVNGSSVGFALDACREFEVYVYPRDLLDNPTLFEYGYGLLLWNGCQDGTATVHALRCRHGVTTGAEAMGIPRHITVHGTARECTGNSYDTHAEADDLIFDGCHAMNSNPSAYSDDHSGGFQIRSPRTKIKGGMVSQVYGDGVYCTASSATDLEITGLTIDTVNAHALVSDAYGCRLTAPRTTVKSVNIINPVGVTGIYLGGADATVMGSVIRRTSGSGGSPITAAAGATNAVVKDNVSRGGYSATFISGAPTGLVNDNNVTGT